MIHPEVRITGLDVDGFSHLCGALASRDLRPAEQLTVLHEGGTVLRVLEPSGVTDRFATPFTDPATRARELLAESGLERVVLLDRAGLDGITSEVVEAAAATTVQSVLLEAAHRAFWTSPAVVTAPEAPPWPWTAVSEALARVADGWLLLGAWDGDRCALRLLAEVRDGLVVLITSPGVAPPRRRATALLDACPAPPAAALLLDLDLLDAVVGDRQPERALARALLDHHEGVLHVHGLEELAWP